MKPKIKLTCTKCKGTTFTATLEGQDRRAMTTVTGHDSMGQACQVVMTCACGEWFAFNVVVPGPTRW